MRKTTWAFGQVLLPGRHNYQKHKDHSGHAEILDISVAESSPRIPHLNEAELGWSQEELGERSGLHPSYIGQIGRLTAKPSTWENKIAGIIRD